MLYWPHIMCHLDQTCRYWLHATCHYRLNFTNSIWHRQSVRTVNSILGGSRVCPLSEVSRTVMILVRTMADVTFRSSGTSRILRKSELCTHVVNYTYIYINKGIHLKSKIQHNGTWLEVAWRPRSLCYRPTVIFRYLHVITLSYRELTFGVSLKMLLL